MSLASRLNCPACFVRGVRVFLVVLASYGAAFFSTGLIHPASAQFGALWASVSGIVVLQEDVGETRHAALLRVWGSLVGVLVAAGYLMLLPVNAFGLAAAAGAAALVAVLLRQKDGGRLAAITVTVILLLGEINPGLHPLVAVALRFFESCLGAALAFAIAWGWRRVAVQIRARRRGTSVPG
jgi:uncharacterized membrane protein YccC